MTSDDGLYLGVDVGTAAALWPVTAENHESPVPLDALSRNIAGCIWLTGWMRYLLGSLIHPGSRIHPVNPPARTAAGRWCRSGQSGREHLPPGAGPEQDRRSNGQAATMAHIRQPSLSGGNSTR